MSKPTLYAKLPDDCADSRQEDSKQNAGSYNNSVECNNVQPARVLGGEKGCHDLIAQHERDEREDSNQLKEQKHSSHK